MLLQVVFDATMAYVSGAVDGGDKDKEKKSSVGSVSDAPIPRKTGRGPQGKVTAISKNICGNTDSDPLQSHIRQRC